MQINKNQVLKTADRYINGGLRFLFCCYPGIGYNSLCIITAPIAYDLYAAVRGLSVTEAFRDIHHRSSAQPDSHGRILAVRYVDAYHLRSFHDSCTTFDGYFLVVDSKFYHCSLRPPFSELMPNLSHRRHLLASCTASSRLMPFSISRKSLPRSLAYLSFSSARPHGLLSMTLGSGMSISSSALILWSYPS